MRTGISTILICLMTSGICEASTNIDKEQEDKMIESESRVIKTAEVSENEIKDILSCLNLTSDSKTAVPKEGRIATNLVISTKEKGEIMLRLYPQETSDKLETGWLQFELDALVHLSDKGLRVPKPLLFEDKKYLKSISNKTVFAYQLLPGNTVKKEELSTDIARTSGQLLSRMTEIATSYIPKENELLPHGDFDYIEKIFQDRAKSIPEMEQSPIYHEMLNFIKSSGIKESIEKTPKGIVHADFFFENFLIHKDEEPSIIDFGDAYYGHVAMDIAIGAMEFSAKSEEEWDFDCLNNFLKPNISWLKRNNISDETFINLMQANCLRFAIYTAPFTIADKTNINDNPYALRFKYLKNSAVRTSIKNIFKALL